MSTRKFGFFAELRRRRVFRVALFYIVTAWVVVQVASEAFPAFDLPQSAIRYVWRALIMGFPVALVFGWRFDIIDGRITHTPDADSDPASDLSLQRADYIILAALVLVAVSIVIGLARKIFDTQIKQVALPDISVPARSVAVLPFENISINEENAPLTAGIHDDLLTRLAKINTLKVISRTSVQQYRRTIETSTTDCSGVGSQNHSGGRSPAVREQGKD